MSKLSFYVNFSSQALFYLPSFASFVSSFLYANLSSIVRSHVLNPPWSAIIYRITLAYVSHFSSVTVPSCFQWCSQK